MDRRSFLQSIGAAALSPRLQPRVGPATSSGPSGGRKAVLISLLPGGVPGAADAPAAPGRVQGVLPYLDRFALARDAGFDAIEMQTISRNEEAAEIREASAKTGLRIHSVMNADHWRFPLSSSDADVVNRSVQGMETSLRNAALWGADTVLLVPAVVDAGTSYRDAWTRSQRVIRERLLPVARDKKVVIAVEEVWNKFLLSPLEFARYVDDFESPWVRAYFDVGNVVLYAFPQDWIRTLGSRIAKIHLKDFTFDRANGRFTWKN